MKQSKSNIEVFPPGWDDGWAAHQGDFVYLQDKITGKSYYGKIRLKAVTCGKKGSTKCPHHIYAYAQFRNGKKGTEKYLGVAR